MPECRSVNERLDVGIQALLLVGSAYFLNIRLMLSSVIAPLIRATRW